MKGEEMIIPPLFRCPISLDLLQDPVTLSTGQTYERFYIQKWLSTGNFTCPVTMQKLQDCSMVPNHTLSHLIHQWLNSDNRLELEDICIGSIKQILESHESTLVNKLQALENVHLLSQELPNHNTCLIDLDFFALLLNLVFRDEQGLNLNLQERLIFVERSLFCALKLMPFSDLGTLNMLKEENTYRVFLDLFEIGNISIKKMLCLIVEAISSNQELLQKLGKSTKLLKEIVHLIENKSEAVESGIRALSSLSSIENNHENLVQEGAVKGLIECLSNVELNERNQAPLAILTIEKLLSVERAKEDIINHPHGVKAIVRMVFRVSNHEGSESAINSLMIICADCKNSRENVVLDGVLTQLLLLLQSQCNGRIKTKARMMLKLLGSMWNDEPNQAL